jgi:hypothetical protein
VLHLKATAKRQETEPSNEGGEGFKTRDMTTRKEIMEEIK